jgi:hypothetical protein
MKFDVLLPNLLLPSPFIEEVISLEFVPITCCPPLLVLAEPLLLFC